MITVLPAAQRSTTNHDGGTLHETALPAGLRSAGIVAVQFDQIEPQGRRELTLDKGMLRLAVVIDGMLEYRDSLGNADSVLGGEVQLLQAAEPLLLQLGNRSATDAVTMASLLVADSPPQRSRYTQRYFSTDACRGHLCCVAAPEGEGDALKVNANVSVCLTSLVDGEAVFHATPAGHLSLVCILSGAALLQGRAMAAGDCAVVAASVPDARLEGAAEADAMLVVLPATRE